MLLLPCAFAALDVSLVRWPFVEYCAHSLSIEPQTESIFLRKLRDFFFSIFLVYGPNAFQVVLVNQAVLPHATHLSFDLFRERFHMCSIRWLGRFTDKLTNRVCFPFLSFSVGQLCILCDIHY
jgi:hypothetical protein